MDDPLTVNSIEVGRIQVLKEKKPYNLYSLKNEVEFFSVETDFILELGTSSPTGKS